MTLCLGIFIIGNLGDVFFYGWNTCIPMKTGNPADIWKLCDFVQCFILESLKFLKFGIVNVCPRWASICQERSKQ